MSIKYDNKKQLIFHVIVKVNLMLENLIKIKSGTTINVNVIVKTHKRLCTQRRLYLES